MLVLQRDIGRKVVLRVPPSDKERVITVHPTKVSKGFERQQAWLAFGADRDVLIVREELETTEKPASAL